MSDEQKTKTAQGDGPVAIVTAAGKAWELPMPKHSPRKGIGWF